MPRRRVLYLTPYRLAAYRWARGSLTSDGTFDTGEEGAAKFAQYVSGSPDSLYYLLADVVEEDFFQENIPSVRGRDRAQLLKRKLAQRYRDTTLTLALSLGSESLGRREERMLLSSFTNTQQFQPWLNAIKASEARLVGVYSVALVSPLVVKRLGLEAARCILISQQEAGLRQTYIEGGKIRFSRLGRVDASDPKLVARACAEESARIQQYLVALRLLPREPAGPLDIVVLAPTEGIAHYQASCVDTRLLKYHVRDLESACRAVGLNSAPAGVRAERLFAYLLASSSPREQFAADPLRRFYNLWRMRVAMITAGAAVFAFCLLFSALKIIDVFQVRQLAEVDRRQQAIASQQYSRLRATFPKTPLSREALKSTIDSFRAVEKQIAFPDRMFVDISKALADAPQVELERLDWNIDTSPKDRLRREAAKPAAAAQQVSQPSAAAPVQFQVAEISARINAVNASDYRNINLTVNQFVETLRAQPGLEVIGTRLPFELDAQRSLSGDIGVEQKSDVPRFTVVIAKRLGT